MAPPASPYERARLLAGEGTEAVGQLLERANVACDRAAIAAFEAGVRPTDGAKAYDSALRAEMTKLKLSPTLLPALRAHLFVEQDDNPGKPARFSANKTVWLPAKVLDWKSPERVTVPTPAGKRTVTVAWEPAGLPAPLRAPFEGQDVDLARRGKEVYLERPAD